ncbi:MAG TPA: DUF1592 domain-containing protein [Chthoniobacteraceae bacterium]
MFLASLGTASFAAAPGETFPKEIVPILESFCYDCHAEGTNKGKVSFDQFTSHEDLLSKRELWLAVLKNVRAGVMPPAKEERPSHDQIKKLEEWIKSDVFAINEKDPDPGRVTLRRLNRAEYRNTIRDLTGFDFKVQEELPPDDTGYGFDNIGDVLTMSPMLLEKYMQAAEAIVAAAVPRIGKMTSERAIAGTEFKGPNGRGGRDKFSVYEEAHLAHTFQVEKAGTYRVALNLEIPGRFEFDPGKARVIFKIDDREVWTQDCEWANGKKLRPEFDQAFAPGEHKLTVEIQPLVPVEKKDVGLDLRLGGVQVTGPMEKEHWVRPKGFDLFFTKDVPEDAAGRREYAREVLGRFATKAFRRPVEAQRLDRLVAMAEKHYTEPGRKFEDGIAQAMVPILASPRFLFRVEEVEPSESGHPLVDEYALASRLSYFLWSTLPDAELFQLAERKELRKNLHAQVNRMLADPRSEALVENFVGQWLQVRDVEGIDINARVVLARDSGRDIEMQKLFARLMELREKDNPTEEERLERNELQAKRRRDFQDKPTVELDSELRRSLRRETQMSFAHVVREDRSVLEFIDADYTFLNERLAKHYGLNNLEGFQKINGGEMRKVTLPPGNVRGGVLTQGAVLVVTSNPTRTSPVKRGLFVLDNILGTPPPPPPPDIPNLEEAEKGFGERQPTLRETLEVHRNKALCSSCHSRMDPLGLAMENFNALGMWRDKERGQQIDASGKLITGETFQDIREVKRALVSNHRRAYFECLTEKLLIYALGRGVEYYDVQTIDQIVSNLEQQNGRFSALLMGIVDSAPFQKRRISTAPRESEPVKVIEHQAKLTP